MENRGKLSFTYGAMASGKSLKIITACHEYEQADVKFKLCKPFCDSKGNDCIQTRFGNTTRKVDYLISESDSLYSQLEDWIKEGVSVIFVDEAQFLTENQVLELKDISRDFNISVNCYGLKNNFKNQLFIGSNALMIHADNLTEIKSICKYCDTGSVNGKAEYNLLFVNGVIQTEGNDVVIDNSSTVEYKPMCYKCMRKNFK